MTEAGLRAALNAMSPEEQRAFVRNLLREYEDPELLDFAQRNVGVKAVEESLTLLEAFVRPRA